MCILGMLLLLVAGLIVFVVVRPNQPPPALVEDEAVGLEELPPDEDLPYIELIYEPVWINEQARFVEANLGSGDDIPGYDDIRLNEWKAAFYYTIAEPAPFHTFPLYEVSCDDATGYIPRALP
jgi:hypothetical protein